METTTQLSYEQLLQLAKQLPVEQLTKFKEDVDATIVKKKSESHKTFREFLLKGPVMADEQYAEFEENRKQFNEWRKK